MASPIVKTMTATVVSYTTMGMQDGAPVMEEHRTAFRGVLDQKKTERQLRRTLGATPFLITSLESGTHRYVMDFEDFILAARIEEGEEPEDGFEDQDEDV